MKEKLRPLVMLALVSLLLPLGEVVIRRKAPEPLGPTTLIDVVLTTYAVYWWYLLDKRQRNFAAGSWQDLGVIFLFIVALPVYFIRSRGWGNGAVAILVMVLAVAASGVLSYVGEQIGWHIAF
jgi:hypothetical protein